jgi:hypothetical protein
MGVTRLDLVVEATAWFCTGGDAMAPGRVLASDELSLLPLPQLLLAVLAEAGGYKTQGKGVEVYGGTHAQ